MISGRRQMRCLQWVTSHKVWNVTLKVCCRVELDSCMNVRALYEVMNELTMFGNPLRNSTYTLKCFHLLLEPRPAASAPQGSSVTTTKTSKLYPVQQDQQRVGQAVTRSKGRCTSSGPRHKLNVVHCSYLIANV